MDLKNKKVLITGATGGIGYNLVNTDEYVAWGKFNP